MSDIAKLWARIEAAKKRLGAADEAQIERIQGINAQVKAVRAGLTERYRELERHREQVSDLRQENEQLRRMLHRLLLAIEQRSINPLREIVKDLEGDVSAMVPLAAAPKALAAPKLSVAAAGPKGDSSGAAGVPPASAAPPSEKDSRWLHEIMERARELTAEDGTTPRAPSAGPPPHRVSV